MNIFSAMAGVNESVPGGCASEKRAIPTLPLNMPVYGDAASATISTLAHMARFIIADLTEAKSIPQELMRIIPALPSVPILPILQVSAGEYGMFEHFKQYSSVLDTYRYESLEEVMASLTEKVIVPAELKANELS